MKDINNGIVINVGDLGTVLNACNQPSREVFRTGNVSVDHVEMKPGDVSLLHRTCISTKFYYILSGDGIMYMEGYGDFPVLKDMLVVIKPRVAHKLRNNSNIDILTHLVITSPAFSCDCGDVEVINEQL